MFVKWLKLVASEDGYKHKVSKKRDSFRGNHVFFVEVLDEVVHMDNGMMERVEQLEEKVKRLEGELAGAKQAQKTSSVRVFGEGLLFLIFGAVVVGPIIAFVISILTWFVEK